MYIYQG